MKVDLLNYTPEPERLCAAAALNCHSSDYLPIIFEKIDQEKISSILRYMIDGGHMSVIEHASFTFGVKEVSRSLTHQLVRHRIASYTQQSQRYVELNNPDYVIANSI